METITLTLTSSKKKINELIQIAKEMGIKTFEEQEVSDEEMALPDTRTTPEQMDKWLAKGDGDESYSTGQMLEYVKGNLAKNRKKKAA